MQLRHDAIAGESYVIRSSSLAKELFFTAAASVGTAAGTFLVTRYLAMNMGPTGFGEICLSNRIFALLAPLVGGTLGSAVCRYAAQSNRPEGILWASLLMAGVVNSAAFILFSAFGERMAAAYLGTHVSAQLLVATVIAVQAFCLFSIAHGYLRARELIHVANAMQFVSGAVLPVAVALMAINIQPHKIVLALAACHLITALPAIALVLRRSAWMEIRSSAIALFQYTAPRIPGTFMQAGLFSIGIFFATGRLGLEEVSYLAIGLSVFRLVEVASSAAGLVGLPRISRLAGTPDGKARIDEVLTCLLGIGLHAGVFLTVRGIIWKNLLIQTWVGEGFLGAAPALGVLSLGVTPYLLFVFLAPVLDSTSERPINAINSGVSLGLVYLLLQFSSGLDLNRICMATVGGLTCLSLLTIGSALAMMKPRLADLLVPQGLAINAVLAGSTAIFSGFNPSLGAVLAVESFLFAVLVLSLSRFKRPWTLLVGEHLVAARA